MNGRQQLARAPEHGEQHLFRQLAGGRVLLAGVIGTDEQRLPGRGGELAVVPEDEGRAAADGAARLGFAIIRPRSKPWCASAP
jgi:hypothetical protein